MAALLVADPWKLDTDGDTRLDNESFTKGSSPLLADTDRDGVRDDRDLAPLGDAFVEVSIESTYVVGSDAHKPGLLISYVSVINDLMPSRSRSSHALHTAWTVGSPHRAHALSAAGGYFSWRRGRNSSYPRTIAWRVPGLSSSRRWTMSRKRPRWARAAYGHVASWNSMPRSIAYR